MTVARRGGGKETSAQSISMWSMGQKQQGTNSTIFFIISLKQEPETEPEPVRTSFFFLKTPNSQGLSSLHFLSNFKSFGKFPLFCDEEKDLFQTQREKRRGKPQIVHRNKISEKIDQQIQRITNKSTTTRTTTRTTTKRRF